MQIRPAILRTSYGRQVCFEQAGDRERGQVLVVIGARPEGRKELVAAQDGICETKQSWRELLADLKARRLTDSPEPAVGDGAPGFWAALRKVFTETSRTELLRTPDGPRASRPAHRQAGRGLKQVHDTWMAETAADAAHALDLFIETYRANYRGATACLVKDQGVRRASDNFPVEHAVHTRTINPIESTFTR